jgi:serine/threonine protein kinase
MQAKLVDYSLSRLAKQLTARPVTTVRSLSHQAPEVLKLGRPTAAADIYAFGVVSESWRLVVPGRVDERMNDVSFGGVMSGRCCCWQ